jgi:CheY-like chemotaxis protein
MSPSPLVLVIDDEVQIRRLLRLMLEGGGYRVQEADSGRIGLSEAAAGQPDGILLDLGLPDMDGTAVVGRLREWTRAPVLVLTVRDGEDDKIAALDAGADDYLTKPFSSRELLARLRALLRRSTSATEPTAVNFGDVTIDLAARIVRRAGAEIKLTTKATGWWRTDRIHQYLAVQCAENCRVQAPSIGGFLVRDVAQVGAKKQNYDLCATIEVGLLLLRKLFILMVK